MYLDAWLPILTSWNKRVLYIDGFAGPGKYKGGEDGSPIIAIKAVKEHKTKIESEIVMLFIEKESDRCSYLENKIKSMDIPKNISYQCICKEFAAALEEIFNFLDEQKKRIAPAFVFIDPFGFAGIPMKIIKRIMENKRCEVLITFMYEDINRFVKNKKIWNCLNETFGTEEWKKVIDIKSTKEREQLLYSIYENQLKKIAKIKFIRAFKMINKLNKLDYLLIFGTNNITGLKAMKSTMWRVDKTGSFQFSDYTFNPAQESLFDLSPNYNILRELIIKKYKDQTVLVRDLEYFVITETPFLNFKKSVLEPLEREDPPLIKVFNDKGRRKYTYKNNYKIKFL